MKLKKCLVILPLLALTLAGCEGASSDSSTSASSSEEETSSEVTTLSNYTLSIEFIYADEVESVPEYADAYIAGSFNNWTFEALTENESRYEITFATIKAGTYEYQVCLGYDAETAGSYSYRITQSNQTLTITGEEGDGYVNKVSLTASNTLDSIIPDPSLVLNNIKVRFNITYNDVKQDALEGASLYITGSWNGWSTTDFVECSVEEGYYVYTFAQLQPITYTFGACLDEPNATHTGWTGQINAGIADGSFEITTNVKDGDTVDGYIGATDTLENIYASLSSEGGSGEVWESGDTITLYFTFKYEDQVVTLEEYEQIYIIGAWNGGNWVNDEAKPLTLGEDNQTYYAEFTYETGTDVVTESHWFTFNLFIASTSESYSWNADRQLLSEDGVWSWENGLLSASWEVELTQPFADYIEDPSTIETRTDCTVYFHFTNQEHTETYPIPSYADGYVTGYFTTGVWTDYVIGSTGKLTAEEDGTYSYTFSQIATGTITYNIYFEYNSSAVNHEAATGASWNASRSIGGSGNTTMVIPATGDVHIDIDVNPADLISDEASTASCTIAVKDTASTGKTLYCSGTMNSWNNSNAMTYDASGSDYQYSYTFTPDSNTSYEFGIFNNSSWADSIQFGTTNSEYWNSGNDLVLAASVIGDYANTLVILTVDGTGFGGTSHVTTTAVTITH